MSRSLSPPQGHLSELSKDESEGFPEEREFAVAAASSFSSTSSACFGLLFRKHPRVAWRSSSTSSNDRLFSYLSDVFLIAFNKSLVAQRLKRLPSMPETQVRSLGREDPLEKEMAAHSGVLAWRIPWTEEPGGLQSTGSQRVRPDWATSLSQWSFLIRLYRDCVSSSAIPAASSPGRFDLQLPKSPSLQGPRVSREAGGELGKFLPQPVAQAPASRLHLQLPHGSAKPLWTDAQPQAALPVLRRLRNLEGCLWHSKAVLPSRDPENLNLAEASAPWQVLVRSLNSQKTVLNVWIEMNYL